MTQNQCLTNLTSVDKTFSSGTKALDALDLKVFRGEFLSLVGPSGCGKSTILRLIAGLMKPTAGTIDNYVLPGKGQVGYVFQDPTLMPWATVLDNVSLPLQLMGQSCGDQDERAAAAIRWIGLSGFETAFPRQLSGGMCMRVSIARALVTNPSLLLLDEPFASLDEFTRSKLNEDLLALWEEHQWTVVFVTHSIREAVFLSDRVTLLSPRPGTLLSTFRIPFPHPRRGDLRDDYEFTDLCRKISSTLTSAMGQP